MPVTTYAIDPCSGARVPIMRAASEVLAQFRTQDADSFARVIPEIVWACEWNATAIEVIDGEGNLSVRTLVGMCDLDND